MKHDIIRINTDIKALKVNANKLDSLKISKIAKSAARVFKNGQIFSSAAVGSLSDAELLKKAENPGNVGLSYSHELPQTQGSENHFANKVIREEGILRFKDFFNKLKDRHSNLNWLGSFKVAHNEMSFASNYTGTLKAGGDCIDGYLLYKRWGSTEFAEGVLLFNGTSLDFDHILQKEEPFMKVLDKKASVKSGKMPVLLLETSNFQQRIREDISPDRFHGNGSFLSGKLNEQIFNKDITFRDISFNPEQGKFLNCDGEGVLHHNPAIFENGVLKNILYDLRQAHKFGTKSTGNGLRNYDTGVDFNLHGLTLMPGQQDHWELLKDIPECLIVSQSYGGSTTDQWEYSHPVQVGFLCRYGEVVGRVPSVSIKASFQDMLGKDLIGLSKDITPGNPGVLTQMEVIVH